VQSLVVFNIPSDADDTGASIALLHRLAEPHVAALLPASAKRVAARGFVDSKAFAALLEFSYCPASADRNRNTIDPRTYYWARGFLNTLTDPDECIVTTWLSNFDRQQATYAAAGAQMPFNVNNVDPTVAGNALYAMSSALLRGDAAWLAASTKAQKLYETTARFVAWTVAHQPNIARPDLETLYYPPTIDIFGFTARHVRLLQSHRGPLPLPLLDATLTRLRAALLSGGMAFLHGAMSPDCAGAEACWDGFLGAKDTDMKGRPTPHHDDRFFTTASAVRGLLALWTTRAPSPAASPAAETVQWLPGTPVAAKALAGRGAAWLLAHHNGTARSFGNAFFSGSIHSFNTLPFLYPANVHLNVSSNVPFTCQNTTGNWGDDTMFAWRGTATEAEYQKLLAAGCAWARNESFKFDGFNGPTPWPFWSAPPLSKAIALQVLSEVSTLPF
jgi:hypothetical protein